MTIVPSLTAQMIFNGFASKSTLMPWVFDAGEPRFGPDVAPEFRGCSRRTNDLLGRSGTRVTQFAKTAGFPEGGAADGRIFADRREGVLATGPGISGAVDLAVRRRASSLTFETIGIGSMRR